MDINFVKPSYLAIFKGLLNDNAYLFWQYHNLFINE
jgi:hypothetical protein